MKKKSADEEIEDNIEEAFKVFDTNNDGQTLSPPHVEPKLFTFSVISADELMKVMISLGNPRTETEIKVGRGDQLSSISLSLSLQEMIAEEDPDGDGVITKDEFKKMLQKKQSDMIK